MYIHHKKMIRIFTLSALLISLLSLEKPSNDLVGDWTVTMTTPRGEMEFEMSVALVDGVYMAETEDGDFEITIEEDEVTWVREMTTPMGEIEVEYEGTIDGSSMEGTATLSTPQGERELEWTAEKSE